MIKETVLKPKGCIVVAGTASAGISGGHFICPKMLGHQSNGEDREVLSIRFRLEKDQKHGKCLQKRVSVHFIVEIL